MPLYLINHDLLTVVFIAHCKCFIMYLSSFMIVRHTSSSFFEELDYEIFNNFEIILIYHLQFQVRHLSLPINQRTENPQIEKILFNGRALF